MTTLSHVTKDLPTAMAWRVSRGGGRRRASSPHRRHQRDPGSGSERSPRGTSCHDYRRLPSQSCSSRRRAPLRRSQCRAKLSRGGIYDKKSEVREYGCFCFCLFLLLSYTKTERISIKSQLGSWLQARATITGRPRLSTAPDNSIAWRRRRSKFFSFFPSSSLIVPFPV